MLYISIIVPVYKVPTKFLQASLESLAAQTMQECEFILVSDGAPEAECLVCEEYAAKDSRFKFFRREHAGVSAARNFGINQAQGEYITFVDADDWIEPETCEMTYKFAKENKSDVVIWDLMTEKNGFISKYNYSSNNIILLSQLEQEQIRKKIVQIDSYTFIGAVVCKLVKKAILSQYNLKFSMNLALSEDRLFFFQLFSKSLRVSYLHQIFYHYRLHLNSATHKYTPNAFVEYKKYFDEIIFISKNFFSKEINNAMIAIFFWSLGIDFFHSNNPLNIKTNIEIIKKMLSTPQLRKAVLECDLSSFSFFIRIEIIFLRKNLYLPLYLHGLKALMWKFLKT